MNSVSDLETQGLKSAGGWGWGGARAKAERTGPAPLLLFVKGEEARKKARKKSNPTVKRKPPLAFSHLLSPGNSPKPTMPVKRHH